MNYLKKIFVLLVTFSIIVLNTVPVNADSWRFPTPQEELQNYRDLYNEVVTEGGYQSWLKRLSKKVFNNVGFLIDESGILIQKIKDAIHGADSNMPSDMTDEEAYNWLKTNLTVSDNIVANDSFNTFVKNYQTTYVNENKYYLGYSLDLQYYDLPADINTFVQEHDDELVFIKRHYNGYFVFTDNTLNTNNFGFVYNSKGTEIYDTIPYSLNTFNRYTRGNPGYNNPYEDGVTVYFWQNGVFTQVTHRAGNYNTAYENFYFMERNYTYRATDFDIPDWTNNWNCLCVSYGNVKEIPIYGTKPLLESSERGTMPYYYNNTVWQDFSSSTGDYTFSPTNINTVTYGDTTTYINDYHDTNNNYPDNSTVNNWINNTNEENITNNNGGGSGGDDSGGGSGSDSPSDIFGWLKQLGAVLGSLIKGVGEFLTEIITGLVSAINSLLSGISDLIQNITESLPTVFMDFLGTLFSWLPDEWVALFSACIIFMLLWGIIKTIRGS